MKIDDFHFTKQFFKQLSALPPRKQDRVRETLRMTLEDADAPACACTN